MVRILLADDHDVVRRGLRVLLQEHAGWEICGEAMSGREAVDLAREMQPDVAIIDLMMPDLNGLGVTSQIRKASERTQVLIFTMHHNETLIHGVLEAGARGYLLKTDAEQHVVTAVETLLRGQPYFSAQVSETVLEGFLRSGRHAAADSAVVPRLTPREGEIIQLLAEGHRNKKIAQMLGISIKTVETHRTALMRKIGVKSIVELVRYAVRNNLTEP
ncbi:MAG: DNA-binding response regulator [Betaproteobacteria bacterium 13_1_20CM_3_63_8]|jgi:DNA-binding NarL/FixJ family response regulator|nr:MAG: DNA-binding response regulator [Betaproteobacteria bacterium 13_1_20CM_3_63_8]TMK13689.1 MAG: response regulator transcription factor [Alphaproteobacteria bacterium]